MEPQGALSPYRVLELPGGATALCGKMLSDLGADVIKIEPPEGDPTRWVEPAIERDGRTLSLLWQSYQRGKRGVTLALDRDEGRKLFERLVATADFLLESFAPGVLARRGLGLERLHALNPRLILVSVTPFGQTGPYSGWKGTDIVPIALGGYMSMSGERGMAPLRVSIPQAFHHASGQAAMGALLAHFQRLRTGKGCHVDVSAHHAQLPTMGQPCAFWSVNRVHVTREGVWRNRGVTALIRNIYPCKDGHVVWCIRAGHIGGRAMNALARRMAAEGITSETLAAIDWYKVQLKDLTAEQIDESQELFLRFFATRSKAELFALDEELSLILAPVYDAKDILQDEQRAARRYWEQAPGDDPRIAYPGPALRMQATPLKCGAMAPTLGQHNQAVFGELGLSAAELSRLRAADCI
ncbi:MAG: CoA transferase [Candidatus Lambdaproteobacteria bacterium]|nr:CoA transferase [Candidatus Lambdaproteobacteria bacterium]